MSLFLLGFLILCDCVVQAAETDPARFLVELCFSPGVDPNLPDRLSIPAMSRSLSRSVFQRGVWRRGFSCVFALNSFVPSMSNAICCFRVR